LTEGRLSLKKKKHRGGGNKKSVKNGQKINKLRGSMKGDKNTFGPKRTGNTCAKRAEKGNGGEKNFAKPRPSGQKQGGKPTKKKEASPIGEEDPLGGGKKRKDPENGENQTTAAYESQRVQVWEKKKAKKVRGRPASG